MACLQIVINGQPVKVKEGTTVAVALLNAGVWRFRQSVHGGPRGPLCAMGICYDCRVEIDGIANRRACMELCNREMVINTDG